MTQPYVVLVGMDFSELADRALQQAFELAARREAAEVHVLCVVPGPSLEAHHGLTGYWLTSETGVRDGVFASLRAHVQVEWDAFIARCPGARVPQQVVSHVRIESPALGLVELAAELAADLIVLGAHGHHGKARLLLGSVAENTMRYAACPVLIVPLEKERDERRTEPPWASVSVPPLSAAHQPSVRPRAP
ncbi:MAG: universal stress protein [Myxococcales bacterium]|jgi:nucleotide-binding universal stress UspA family protein